MLGLIYSIEATFYYVHVCVCVCVRVWCTVAFARNDNFHLTASIDHLISSYKINSAVSHLKRYWRVSGSRKYHKLDSFESSGNSWVDKLNSIPQLKVIKCHTVDTYSTSRKKKLARAKKNTERVWVRAKKILQTII